MPQRARSNPPVRTLRTDVRRVVDTHLADLRRLGVDVGGWKACGAWGCVLEDLHDPDIVWKLTRDRDEVRFVDLIADVRAGRDFRPRTATRARSKARRLGIKPRHYRASGIVWMDADGMWVLGRPSQGWMAYRKERVRPLDATSDWRRRESFHYTTGRMAIDAIASHSPAQIERVISRDPRWGEVLRTAWALRSGHGIALHDAHDSNVGTPLRRRYGRPAGEFVLMDAQAS